MAAADDLERAMSRLASAVERLEGAITNQGGAGGIGGIGDAVKKATKPKSSKSSGLEALFPNWENKTDEELQRDWDNLGKNKKQPPTAATGPKVVDWNGQTPPPGGDGRKPPPPLSDKEAPREHVPWNRRRNNTDWLGDAVHHATAWKRPGLGRDVTDVFASKIGNSKVGRLVGRGTAKFRKTRLGQALGTKATRALVGRAVGRGAAALVGRGVGAATGAAVGGAAGGPVGLAVGAAIGMVVEQAVGALSKFKDAIQEGAKEQERYNRQFADFSADMASVQGEKELREAVRKTEKGNRLAGTARELMRAEQGYEDETKNLEVLLGNIKNTLYAAGERFLTKLLKPLDVAAEAANKYLFGEAEKGGLSWYQWMEEIRKAEEAERAKVKEWHRSADTPRDKGRLT